MGVTYGLTTYNGILISHLKPLPWILYLSFPLRMKYLALIILSCMNEVSALN